MGDRFVIQADIYYKGVNLAFGYMLPGGLEQYVRISDEILRGDDGCYLLSINPQSGYAEAALAEPWACVVRAYRDTRRNSMVPGGKTWLICTPDCEKMDFSLSGIDVYSTPAEIVISNAPDVVTQGVYNLVSSSSVKVTSTSEEDLQAVAENHAPDGFDDIFVLGNDADIIESAARFLGKNGFLSVVTTDSVSRLLNIDVGRVHYDNHQYVGATPHQPLGGYNHPRSLKLVKDGLCWICGAGGPMGQMHVQLALEASDGPRMVVATDIDSDRLALLPERFGETARRNGCELVLLNPKELGERFEEKLWELAPAGFDDVVCLVPVPVIISQCSRFMGERGVLNIFAGVPRGTMADVDFGPISTKNVRMFGSSGSSIEDLQQTLDMTAEGELSPNMAVAAIGGIEAAKEGLGGVQDSAFPGKIVIYPQIQGLPLTALEDLHTVLPDVAALLGPGNTWTNEAEQALLAHFIDC